MYSESIPVTASVEHRNVVRNRMNEAMEQNCQRERRRRPVGEPRVAGPGSLLSRARFFKEKKVARANIAKVVIDVGFV